MNFKAFYGLSCNPFDKHSLKISDSFESSDQKSMMNRLSYLKDVRGIGVFTASPGMGKSFCLRQFESSLNKNLYDMKYVCLSTVSVGEFYKQLCDQLGLETKGGKTVMFKAIQDRIHYLYKEKKQPLILAIDEAQYLSNAVLKDLKMLMNFNYDSLNCFTLILSGEPYLNCLLQVFFGKSCRHFWRMLHLHFGEMCISMGRLMPPHGSRHSLLKVTEFITTPARMEWDYSCYHPGTAGILPTALPGL